MRDGGHPFQGTFRARTFFLFFLLPLGLFAQTGMTNGIGPRSSVIVDEDFNRADAIRNWRLGAGHWIVTNGSLIGTETPERKHAAGLACPRLYRNAEISFRVSFRGGHTAMLLLRNQMGNLCRITLTPRSVVLTRDRPNSPATNREKTVVLAERAVRFEPDAWIPVQARVQGGTFTVTLPEIGTLEGHHPALDVDKTEIEFLAGGRSIWFDDLRAIALP